MINDRSVVAASLAIVVAVRSGSLSLGGAALLVATAASAGDAAVSRSRDRASGGPAGVGRWVVFWCLVGLLVVGGAIRSQRAWAGLQPDTLGSFQGWADVVDDPQPYDGATRVILRLEGERFELWARGRALRQRVASWRAGEQVLLAGERRLLDEERARRVAWQHVVGRFDLDWASDVRTGAPVAAASNRVRAALERASATMPANDAALYRGLVIGDDSDQPPEMIERFRASGLSHLTAVSGQNIVLLLAACGPLLRRLGTTARWSVTIGLIGWFVVLTRFEPSILRAGAMAMLAATAYATGREHAPVRTLAVAVGVLLVIDPLMCWSIGFWLSVGATFGVAVVGPWLAARLSMAGILAMPLAITLGAQLGVAVPSLLVFGRMPLVSVPANMLAVPVAGFVMLYGLPVGLLVGLVPGLGGVAMSPAWVGTRWVDTVAALGARLEPTGSSVAVGWVVIVVVVTACGVASSGKNEAPHGDPSAHR